MFDIFRATDIPAHDRSFLRQYKLVGLYDTTNGLTLCSECHTIFDALLCCVKVETQNGVISHKLIVADALKADPEHTEKWVKLDGADVRVPSLFLHLLPPKELFQFRLNKYQESAAKRREVAQGKPNVCHCGKRTRTPLGLAQHIRSKVCLERVIFKSNKYSTLHTPEHIASAISGKHNHLMITSTDRRLFSITLLLCTRHNT